METFQLMRRKLQRKKNMEILFLAAQGGTLIQVGLKVHQLLGWEEQTPGGWKCSQKNLEMGMVQPGDIRPGNVQGRWGGEREETTKEMKGTLTIVREEGWVCEVNVSKLGKHPKGA